MDAAALEAAKLVMADAFDADLIMKWLRASPKLQAVLYSGEPRRSSARQGARGAAPGRAHGPPVVRRAAARGRPAAHRAARAVCAATPAPFDAHLAWGASGFAYSLTDAKGRDHAVQETMAFAGKLGAPKRVGEMLGELAHELIMNALYDAPVDEMGKPRYAHDRKAEIALGPEDAAVFRCGSDGVRIAVEMTDHFGRLERKHVFGGLVRGLKAGPDGHRRRRRRARHARQLPLDDGALLRRRAAAAHARHRPLRSRSRTCASSVCCPKTIHFPEGT